MFNAWPGNVSEAAPQSGQPDAPWFLSHLLVFLRTHWSLQPVSRRLKDDRPENSNLTASDRRERRGFVNLPLFLPPRFSVHYKPQRHLRA